MDEKEKKVKKQWLVTLTLSAVFGIVNGLITWRFNPTLAASPPLPLILPLFILILHLLTAPAFFFIAYRCAYRKPGTKLLTFCLVATGISLILTPILYLRGAIQPLQIPYYGLYQLAFQGFAVWWMVICWRMRKLNKRLRVLSVPSGEKVHTQ